MNSKTKLSQMISFISAMICLLVISDILQLNLQSVVSAQSSEAEENIEGEESTCSLNPSTSNGDCTTTTDDDIDESSEEEDSSSSSSDIEMSEGNSDDENNDKMDEDSDNDTEEVEPSTTKTPANKQSASSKKTPNSSPGMKMRSGRKKKRKKSISPKNNSKVGAPSTTKKKRGATTNPRKRAKKITDLDNDNDDDEEDSVSFNGGKRNGKKTASKLVNGNDSSDEEEETHTKKKKKGNRRKSVGFDATTKKGSRRAAIDENATIRKVPHAHEQTREAVAAAQMSQSPTMSEESAAAANNSSGSSNTGGIMGGSGGLLHLVSQTLRLPSQHTPAKPQQQQDDTDDNLDSDAESPAPPLAGGRRLIFATTAKKKAGGGGRTGGRNKLLMQTREKQQQQQREKSSTKKQTATTTTDSTPESNDDNDDQEEPSSLLVQLTNEWEENGEEYKKDIALYTKGWFFVLFLCFIVGNIANVSLFNVRSQSTKLSKLYGIESKITDTVLETPDGNNNNGEGATTTTPPEIVTITQPDPDLIANARATYRAERMNTHDISKIEKSMDEMNMMMKVVDDTMTSWMKDYPHVAFGETKDDDNEQQNKDESVNKISASIIEKQNVLLEWEWALVALEEAMDAFANGDISPEEVNKAMDELTRVSMMKSEATVLDMSKISVPGEGCEGMDYNNIPTKQSDSQVGKEDTVEVVGGIDVDALDIASDSPVLIEDAKNVYQSLVTLAQSTSEALIGPSGASTHAKQWLEQVIAEELHKRGVDENPPSINEATIPSSSGKSSPSNTDGVYTFNDAVTDIDRLLEIEDADRTGKFDYASIVNGAQVVRRGPYATSYSLYETLPLINRVLAYTKLRFYGHPPEAALVPTFPMHTRGQCWSFTNEQSSSRTRRQAGGGSSGDMIGDYATLTISLPSAISVSEVLVEHIPQTITSDPTSSAMKEFRVLGFEDTGAFGEPWELGSFVFNNVGPSIQRFAIQTTLDGQNVPKLSSIAFAVDTNWGGEYTCLYRVRVHQ